jgi:hypothetical protein
MDKNQDPDPVSGMDISGHISESLETIFGLKVLQFFNADPGSGIFFTLEPGSGKEKFGAGIRNLFILDPGSRKEKFESGIRDKHPGSATLFF